MPTRESILGYGANITNFLATAGAKLKKDRAESIKENIDTYYSKGKSLFYDGDKQKDPLTIATDLKRGVDAYTSLGYTNEAELLKKHYTEQTEQMKLDRSNAYWKNTVEMNTKTKFPEGDVPAGVDLSKIPIRDKGVKSFTTKETLRDGKYATELWNFNPDAEEGKEWTLGKTLPGYNIGIPKTYGETYKAGTEPDPVEPVYEPMQMMNVKTGKPELVKFEKKSGQYIGGDGQPLDASNYRQLTDNEKKGELIQKKNPPDDSAVYSKFMDEQKDKVKTLFDDSAQEYINKYLYGGDGDAIMQLKETYKDSPAQLQFLDKLYNLRENKFGEKQRIMDEYFK